MNDIIFFFLVYFLFVPIDLLLIKWFNKDKKYEYQKIHPAFAVFSFPFFLMFWLLAIAVLIEIIWTKFNLNKITDKIKQFTNY